MKRASRIHSGRRISGFTLIELMVVVLTISVLAAIAVPTYQVQVRKGRRTDAKTALLDLAAREERYYAASNGYTSDTGLLGYATATGSTNWTTIPAVGSGYYQVSVTSTATTFTASASVVSGTPQVNDTACQYFSVDNTGTQMAGTSSSTAATGSTCWQ
jgi:type IV pilus assembly protein PilE